MPVPAANISVSQAGHESLLLTSSEGRGQTAADRAHEARMHAVLVDIQRKLSSQELGDTSFLNLCVEAALAATGAEGACVQLQNGSNPPLTTSAGTAWPGIEPLGLQDNVTGWLMAVQGEVKPLQDADLHAALVADADAAVLLRTALRGGSTGIGAVTAWSGAAVRQFEVRDLENLNILGEVISAHLQARAVADQLRASRLQYQNLFDLHPSPMYVVTQDQRMQFLAVNDAAVHQYGYARKTMLHMALPDLWPDDQREALFTHVQNRMKADDFADLRRTHQRRDGSRIEVQVSSRGFEFDGQVARHCMAIDVTERLAAERELASMARSRHLLSACNEAIVRCPTETELLKAVCAATVEIGGYRMAWVGLAQLDVERTISVSVCAGANQGYLEGLALSWDADSPHGKGPSGVAIRTGKAVVVPDVRQSDELGELAERLLHRGFYGMVCLPLREHDCTFGVLYLYAPEVLNLSAREVELLEELAQDLAFGLNSLRARQTQQRMQAAVVNVAATVSASTGNAFFHDLTLNMARAVGAESACIGRFVPNDTGTPEKLLTLALVVNGELVPNAEYALHGTPSERLVSQYQLCVEDQLRTQFPNSVVVEQTLAEAYAGQQLCDSSGAATGVLFVLFRDRLHNAAFVQSTLQIFASRVSAELERQGADQQIRWQASMLDQARDAIVVLDMGQKVTYWNKGAERLYGWTSSEVLGRRANHILHLSDTEFQQAATQVLATGDWAGEMTEQHRDGTAIDTEGRWTLVRGATGEADSILAISTDIRERKSTQQEIQRLAFYDVLTGLPNRMLLMDRAEHALAQASRTHSGGAMLFIDLDNFKTLNDTLGHDKGDLLLQQVATRLQTCVRVSDTVARLGGDEFVVMLSALSNEARDRALEAQAVAEKILTTLAMPYQLGSHHYRTTPSIGIAPFSSGDGTVGDLLKQADLAMYQAKMSGRNTLRFFDPQMQAVVSARAALEADMRAALAQGEFSLHYQPQVRHNGEIIGVEALARWTHPGKGNISPAEFIPVAEDTGLILTLGRWVLHTACLMLAQWKRNPRLLHLTMAVNVSSRQFRSTTFVDDVSRILAVTGAPAKRLKLELTESVLVEDVEDIIGTMEALRLMGVNFSLDDFGTGYSSLSYLKRMPLQQIKIDQSFVRDLLSDPNDAAIVDTIVALSAALGLDVIAEGVESLDQREMLLEAGCMTFQGYLYSRPLTAAALEQLLNAPDDGAGPSL